MDQFELNHLDTTLPSKAAVVRALLRLEGGATLNEIMNATGWKACSWSKVGGISRYTLEVL